MPPEELLRAVRADLEPVRPLASPARRALALAAWAPVALIVVLALFGLRPDAAVLGWPLTWGTVIVQMAAGLALGALALAETVPGLGPPRGRVVAMVVVACAAFVALAWLTRDASPGKAVRDPLLTFGPACFAMLLLVGLPALAVAAALFVRAAPLRLAGALVIAGAGAGVMAEGIYHLHCWVTDLRHVLVWHGGAVVALALVGLAAGVAWDRREGRRMLGRLGRRTP